MFSHCGPFTQMWFSLYFYIEPPWPSKNICKQYFYLLCFRPSCWFMATGRYIFGRGRLSNLIIFLRNASFQEYYVFVSAAAAASAAASSFSLSGIWRILYYVLQAWHMHCSSKYIIIIDIVVPSKMAADGHFVKHFKTKKKKFRIDLKWPEMRSKVNFGHLMWSPAAILFKNVKKTPAVILSKISTTKRSSVSYFTCIQNLSFHNVAQIYENSVVNFCHCCTYIYSMIRYSWPQNFGVKSIVYTENVDGYRCPPPPPYWFRATGGYICGCGRVRK